MAHLWIEEPASRESSGREPAGWCIVPLSGGAFSLDRIPPAAPRGATLVPAGHPGRTEWHLLAGEASGIRVNGFEMAGGIRTLMDHDEIRVPGAGTVFFSTERLAAVEPFPPTESGQAVSCPRCRQIIPAGEAAVQCPSCGIWHHGTEALPCWSYAPGCAMCGHPTPMDTGYRWTPEAL